MPSPEALLDAVYTELRGLADRFMRRRSPGQTLQPTALVHEAYLKLASHAPEHGGWESRAHFFAVAAKAMRQILANHSRERSAQQRERGGDRETLSGVGTEAELGHLDLLALHDALTELAAFDSRRAELVELRFVGGMTMPEIAHAMNVSTATLERDWRVAKAWIGSRLE